jgi:hypothetical protein
MDYTPLTLGRHGNHHYLAETTPLDRDEYAPREARAAIDPMTRLADALARHHDQPLALDVSHRAHRLQRHRERPDHGHGIER